nr:MAG TPA: YopX protein [Siphoviridae sp. ctD5s5]
MNDRFKFRAGFKVCYYDKDGNDKELLVKVNDCFAIENGGETIVVHADIIGELLSNSGILAQGLEYMRANFCYDNDYWLIDKLEYLDQCTGLKDRNGKLIYDGDIVKLSSDREVVCPVVWDNEETGFCVEYKKELYRFNTYKKYQLIEVIGNIHENKELI